MFSFQQRLSIPAAWVFFVCRLVWNLLGWYFFVPLFVGFFAPRMCVPFPNRMTSTAVFLEYITSLCLDSAFAVFNNPLQLVLGCFLSLPQSSQGQQEQRANRNHRERQTHQQGRKKHPQNEKHLSEKEKILASWKQKTPKLQGRKKQRGKEERPTRRGKNGCAPIASCLIQVSPCLRVSSSLTGQHALQGHSPH